MAILEVIIVSFLSLLHISYASQRCSVATCSDDPFPVRFPFRLEFHQPQTCGYPGFVLSCNNQGKTVLKLPNSSGGFEFLVRGINYLTQQIQLYDGENCLPKQLLHFNLSGSPFYATFYQNYTFLSCPSQYVESRLATIDCLGNSTVSVLATSSVSVVRSMSSRCQVIATRPIPVTWPVQNEGFSSELNDDVELTWSSPDCEECETQGGVCGFQGNSTQEIGCSYPSGGSSTNGLQVFKVICFSIAVPAILCATGIAAFACFMDRRRLPLGGTTRNNNTATTMAPQPPTNILPVGLDETVIESYEKLVVGESKRLPGPNGPTCAICLSEYLSKETVRCIPECNHCFHSDCIDEWLRLNGTCPVCRNSPSPPRFPS